MTFRLLLKILATRRTQEGETPMTTTQHTTSAPVTLACVAQVLKRCGMYYKREKDGSYTVKFDNCIVLSNLDLASLKHATMLLASEDAEQAYEMYRPNYTSDAVPY